MIERESISNYWKRAEYLSLGSPFGHPSVRVRNAFGKVSMIERGENDYETGLLIEKNIQRQTGFNILPERGLADNNNLVYLYKLSISSLDKPVYLAICSIDKPSFFIRKAVCIWFLCVVVSIIATSFFSHSSQSISER